eukprot:m.105881 g.105881  ORF g.105881 m.105881 type:complete len:272 (+) comp13891_c1_seq9:104-919(+)
MSIMGDNLKGDGHNDKIKQSGNGKRKHDNPIYGNYRSYYNKRRRQEEDPRLSQFKLEWFENKDVLDIGCNSGDLTIEFVRKLKAANVLGVDIDRGLVARANRLAKSNYARHSALQLNDAPFIPVSFLHIMGSTKWSPMDNVKFLEMDFCASEEVEESAYDVITCLSTVKWIHLHHGDEGVKRLFRKVYKALRSGGRFILEPQPWQSYRKKRWLSPEIKATFQSIVLKPIQFKEFLLNEIGFASCTIAGAANDGSKFGSAEGCKRDIQVYTK